MIFVSLEYFWAIGTKVRDLFKQCVIVYICIYVQNIITDKLI